MNERFPPNFVEVNSAQIFENEELLTQKNNNLENDIDIEGLIMWGFKNCFEKKGEIALFEKEGFLVAPGELRNKTESKHDCTLVLYNNNWVWEDRNVLEDRIIYNSGGQRSITLINIKKNDKISIIYCSKSGGKHKVKKNKSFIFDGKELVFDEKTIKHPINH